MTATSFGGWASLSRYRIPTVSDSCLSSAPIAQSPMPAAAATAAAVKTAIALLGARSIPSALCEEALTGAYEGRLALVRIHRDLALGDLREGSVTAILG